MAEKNGGYKLETPGKMEIIRRITERLQSYLSSLQQDNGCRPRRFDLFEVADPVAYLTGGAERQARRIQRGLQGRAEPPVGFSPPDAVSLSASNAQRDITLRQRLAGSLMNTFVENHTWLHQLPDGIWNGAMANLLLARQARAHARPRLRGPATPGISDPRLGHQGCYRPDG